MKQYYIFINEEQLGPFNIEELKNILPNLIKMHQLYADAFLYGVQLLDAQS